MYWWGDQELQPTTRIPLPCQQQTGTDQNTPQKCTDREQKSRISRIQGKIAGEFPSDSLFVCFTVVVSPFYAGIWNRHCQNTVKTATQSGSHNLGRNSRILCQISAEVSVIQTPHPPQRRPMASLSKTLHPPGSFPSQPHSPAAAVTFRMLYRCTSQKSRTPISVPMYQPLKGHAVNSRPPTSRSMLATAGSAYHFRSSSLNHSYLLNKRLDLLLYVSFLL